MRAPLLPVLRLVLAGAAVCGAAEARASVRFFDSVRSVPSAGSGAHVARRSLSAAELAAPLVFSVALKMRDLDELQERLAAGAKISRTDLESNYLPLQPDYDRVASWLAAQGFSVVGQDPNRTVVTVQGSVALAARALGVTFGRVAVPAEGSAPAEEVTSALDAPVLPEAVAGPVLGFHGLQPHIRFHHAPVRARAAALPQGLTVKGFPYITPPDLAAAYHSSGVWTGKGQTIAIIDDASYSTSDLNTFWSTVGSSQTSGNVTQINVSSSPNGDPVETSLDVEWAGAIAPGAQLRVYVASDALLFNCITKIIGDLPSNPSLTVVSMSFGLNESDLTASSAAIFAAEFAQLAAAGVTVVASSGDGGSNPSDTTGSYGKSNPLTADYPASDPSVTGVGGTSMSLDSNFTDQGEVAWNAISGSRSQSLATGGGISTLFTTPSWQTGTNSSMRSVPDVAAAASATVAGTGTGAYIQQGGGVQGPIIGTSLACPVWAGFCAQINQARAAAGLSTLGLLGPKLYPLAGSSAFTDITSGNNGAYSAGAGYDLCTGLGTPNVANLIAALAPTPASSSSASSSGGGGGGGGGAPSLWFLGCLALLGAARAAFPARQPPSGVR